MPDHYRVSVEGADAPLPVREMGSGGIVIESARPLLRGEAMRFVLHAPGADGIGPMEGHVAHSRMLLAPRSGAPPVCLAGVTFDRVEPEHAARLAAVLADIDGRRARRPQDVP